MEKMESIEQILREPLRRVIDETTSEPVSLMLESLKASFVSANNEIGANSIAIQQAVFEIQNNYIRVFKLFKNKDFYAAWCLLERIEIDIKWLLRHYDPIDDEYKILFIKQYVHQLQGLFPYKLFGSSEYIKKLAKCSICGTVITLRNRCRHKKGELYMGQRCSHEILEAEMLAIAVVEVPFNKYSVFGVTSKEDDPYSYP
jgi:hypothetical protein